FARSPESRARARQGADHRPLAPGPAQFRVRSCHTRRAGSTSPPPMRARKVVATTGTGSNGSWQRARDHAHAAEETNDGRHAHRSAMRYYIQTRMYVSLGRLLRPLPFASFCFLLLIG